MDGLKESRLHTFAARRSGGLVLLRDLGFTVLICTAIALLLWAIARQTFLDSLIFSLCIGISTHLLTVTAMARLPSAPIWQVWMVTVPAGVFLGMTLGAFINNVPLAEMIDQRAALMSLVIALIATYIFYSYYSMNEMRETLHQQAFDRVMSEKRLLETELKLLQSQIEPHFLFNTLSHVLSLINTDAERAELMLRKLSQFLRASLQRSRSEHTTLQDELDLINDYLSILQIRMGDRLRFEIHNTTDAAAIALPPLILQPLVENAVVHGIEPLEEGGTIRLEVRPFETQMAIVVADDGPGLGLSAQGTGFGLANVRERLYLMFGNTAKLELADESPRGLRVTVTVPYRRLR
ncbi:MAG: sensor histidine kinase [Pseudomonadota bacterium]